MRQKLIKQNAAQAAEQLETAYEKEYLRSKDVETIFSISNSTLKLLRQRGEIPCYRFGKTYLYKKVELEAMLERMNNQNPI